MAASSFTCPTKPLEEAQAGKIKALLPTGDAFENIQTLNAAVTTLKAENANPALVIDSLVSAYCPVLASESITDAHRLEKFQRFASRVTRTVYALDGADQIILDVAFPPAVVDAIAAKAKAAGVTSEVFIQNSVAAALQ